MLSRHGSERFLIVMFFAPFPLVGKKLAFADKKAEEVYFCCARRESELFLFRENV